MPIYILPRFLQIIVKIKNPYITQQQLVCWFYKFIIVSIFLTMDGEQRHMMGYVLPNTVCKVLNNAVIIINLWWSKNRDISVEGMGIATIFSFVFGYLIIISLNIGLTYQISRQRYSFQLVGIFYQRALLINFLFCAFIITPLLYLSKNIVGVLQVANIGDHDVATSISQYLYQLVPSIYFFAFYDTTQSFLQAQGHILAPLIIQVMAVFLHLLLIQHLGPAWSKNIIDLFSSVAIYLYIYFLSQPLFSWIQWNIKCVKGWRSHMKFLEIIGLTTYLQALFFFFFTFLAYNLQKDQLICHICFINIYQIVYLIFIGIKEGALSTIGYHIKANQYLKYKKQGERSIKIFCLTSVVLILFLFIYQNQVCSFFLQNQNQQLIFKNNFWILSLAVLVDSLNIGVSSLLKALNKNYSILKFNVFFYSISLMLGYLLCYYPNMGLTGLWCGWIIGIGFNLIWSFILLKSKDSELRTSYKKSTSQLKPSTEEYKIK